MNFSEIHNLDLIPNEIEGYENALKNFTLFTKIDNNEVAAVAKEHMAVSFDYLSKQEYEHEVVFLNDISFERLYNRFLEVKTDKEMAKIQSEQEDAMVEEDDMSIAEFLKTSSDILTSEESAPIIKFVNSLFYQAIKRKSSDIHIEMHEFKGEVRYRVDGVLSKHIELDKNIMSLVISRIKVISNLDISEKRIPQDGRTQVKIAGRTLDVRVSALPTFYGERIVMRILMQSSDIPRLEGLGFAIDTTKELEKLLSHTHGMILVTGPTGSGKSTTLHSLLQRIVTPEKNIITVEDPVEYKSDEINQIQVNSKVGLTFASGLRSILRQDPDVIMVGEIRDKETAQISIQAALTGHLVFSTLHTNTATASITRLVDMGVERFLISSSLLGVLAQRLVRKLCKHCKEEDIIAEYFASEFGLPLGEKIYKSAGCRQCNYTGYSGRTAVGELFVINDTVRQYLKKDVDDAQLQILAVENSMIPLSTQLKQMLLEGETSMNEAVRIGLK